jgi:hypothetical protein
MVFKMLDKDLRFLGKNTIKLGPDIYLYKNFYHDLEAFEFKLNSIEEDMWNTHGNYSENDHKETFWDNKLSPDFVNKDFHDTIINFVSPRYWILSHGNFLRLKSGEKIYDQEHTIPKEFKYILGFYAGDFTGGEINFIDFGITYKPEKNDLIIFKPTNFKVGEVTSGIRYSYLDYIIEHPGYILV